MNGGTTSSAPGTTFGKVIARRIARFGLRSLRTRAAVASRLRPKARRSSGITRHALACPCLEPLVSSAQVCSPDADEHDLRLRHQCTGTRVGSHLREQHPAGLSVLRKIAHDHLESELLSKETRVA